MQVFFLHAPKIGISQIFVFISGRKYKWLGNETRKSTNNSAYMSILSRGGLKMPSETFLKYLNVFECRFRNFHEIDVYSGYDPIGSLATLLKTEFPHIGWDLLYLFCKTRFFIRLKKLNNDLQLKKKKFRRSFVKFVSKFK